MQFPRAILSFVWLSGFYVISHLANRVLNYIENGSTRRGPPPLISNGTGSPSTSPTRSPQSGNVSEADRIEDGAGNPEVSGDTNWKVREIEQQRYSQVELF